MKNTLIGAVVVAAILGAVAFFGASPFIKTITNVFGSAQGTTYNDAKFAATVINLANPGANATSTSILNSDVGNRYVNEWRVGCTGVGTSNTAYTGAGLVSLQVTVGTTTTAAPAVIPSQSLIASAAVVATTSTSVLVASSTLATGSELASVWPSGTYETFWFNATNTAACTVGLSYFGS